METQSGESLRIEKEFGVPVEKLFRAWTEPDQLKQWWKPLGNQLVEVKNDLREGGEVEYRFETDSQNNLTIKGQYLEVRPNEKLEYTWNWLVGQQGLNDSEYKLKLFFSSSGEGSKLEVNQENFKDRESVLPHQQGWQKSLEDLSQFLGGNSGNELKMDPDQQARPDYGSQNPAEE